MARIIIGTALIAYGLCLLLFRAQVSRVFERGASSRQPDWFPRAMPWVGFFVMVYLAVAVYAGFFGLLA